MREELVCDLTEESKSTTEVKGDSAKKQEVEVTDAVGPVETRAQKQTKSENNSATSNC